MSTQTDKIAALDRQLQALIAQLEAQQRHVHALAARVQRLEAHLSPDHPREDPKGPAF
jgi:uncharacterized coiled-coil protein SlyX